MPYRRAGWIGKGREALSEGGEGSGVPPGGSGRVGKPYRRAVGVGRPSQRDGMDRKAILERREGSGALPLGQEVSGGPIGGLGGVKRLCRWAGRCREALQEGREGSEALQDHWEGLGRLFWRAGRDRMWLGGPSGGLGVVGRP